MNKTESKLAQLIDRLTPRDGFRDVVIPGVRLVKFSKPRPPQKAYWRSSLAIVVQGHKTLSIETDIYRYEQSHYIATPIDLPVTSHISRASAERPFLSVMVPLDLLAICSISSQMKPLLGPEVEVESYGIFTGEASKGLLESVTRLLELESRPEDAEVLGPIILREVYFHLLKTPGGAALRQFTTLGTKWNNVVRVISKVAENLEAKIDTGGLAKQAGMSRTGFFVAFKALTAMSPIQYQKRLRLMEARQLILTEGQSAEGASYQVGYKSPSQFSREYARMFGNPPFSDTKRMREADKV